MDPANLQNPGPSSALDYINVELSAIMSPHDIETYHVPDIPFEISDFDLYGILSGSNDELLDEMTNMDPEEVIDLHDTLPDAQDEEREDTTPEQTTDWCSGNPENMVEIPFTGTPGMLPVHQGNRSPLEFFFLFFSNQIINLILECTNKYGNRLKEQATLPRARFHTWNDVNIDEFKIFLGILLLMGTIKLNRMADYWSNHYLFRLCSRLYMSRDRFFMILRALSVQKSERTESLLKIKPLIDLFNENTDSIYYPSKEIAIDESLILWKGRLSFRQYLKGKAHRYGIKLYILADANGIILKIHVYAGAQDKQVGGKNHVQKVVMLLMDKYLDKGHSLYVDNFYSSVQLADVLIGRKTYVTGTLRANRVGNPREVINAKLKVGESCIMFNRKKTVVTQWRDKKVIFFVSTEHKSDYIGTNSQRVRRIVYKPAVQVHYNKYMRAIDKHDQLLSYYCCEHKTLRWYKKVIIHIIQICLVNGFLLYNKEINKTTLYDFRKSCIENLLSQINEPSHPPLVRKIHLPTNLPKRNGKTIRKRCRVCYGKEKKRVAVIFGCPDCPGFPGLCLECFREFHKY